MYFLLGERLHDLQISTGIDGTENSCGFYEGSGVTGERIVVYCSSGARGRYVLMTILTPPEETDVLTVCEVQVFVTNWIIVNFVIKWVSKFNDSVADKNRKVLRIHIIAHIICEFYLWQLHVCLIDRKSYVHLTTEEFVIILHLVIKKVAVNTLVKLNI